jgi:hypothetical protein
MQSNIEFAILSKFGNLGDVHFHVETIPWMLIFVTATHLVLASRDMIHAENEIDKAILMALHTLWRIPAKPFSGDADCHQ